MRFRGHMALVGLLLSNSCGGGPSRISQQSPPSSPAVTPNHSPQPSPSPPAPSSDVETAFIGSVSTIDVQTRERMTHSWREGCPVAIEDLRVLRLNHWGWGGVPARGELIVHEDQADRILGVFRKIFEEGFPIERMELVDTYGGDDDRSMEANNTSAFNCREVDNRPGVWSQHAYGKAIDINPIQNPYVSASGEADPPQGAPFRDRSRMDPGVIHSDDAVVRAFASAGWKWGGYWKSAKDYQHFSSNGR